MTVLVRALQVDRIKRVCSNIPGQLYLANHFQAVVLESAAMIPFAAPTVSGDVLSIRFQASQTLIVLRRITHKHFHTLPPNESGPQSSDESVNPFFH